MHAALQATLHNAHFRGEHQPAWKPSDFMPKEPVQVKSGEERWRHTMMIIREQFQAAKDKFRAMREGNGQ